VLERAAKLLRIHPGKQAIEMPHIDKSFVPTRKGINISQLYTTLISLRESISIDDDYERLYFKLLRNLSNTKKLRNFIYKEFDLKLNICKIQNLATFVLCCYNLTKINKWSIHFAHCLLPPPTSDYISWQRAILMLLKARKSKNDGGIQFDYKFQNSLILSRYESRDGDYNSDMESTCSSTFTLPSISPCKIKKLVHSDERERDTPVMSDEKGNVLDTILSSRGPSNAPKLSKRHSGELPILVGIK